MHKVLPQGTVPRGIRNFYSHSTASLPHRKYGRKKSGQGSSVTSSKKSVCLFLDLHGQHHHLSETPEEESSAAPEKEEKWAGNATCLPYCDLQPGDVHSCVLFACDRHTEPYLVRCDIQGGIGQLCLILGLLPRQTSCFFHLLELLCKLEESGKVTLVLRRNAERAVINVCIAPPPFAASFNMLFNSLQLLIQFREQPLPDPVHDSGTQGCGVC